MGLVLWLRDFDRLNNHFYDFVAFNFQRPFIDGISCESGDNPRVILLNEILSSVVVFYFYQAK